MQLNPSEISELIKDRIKNFEGAAEARTEGTVVSLMDGIARIHGLADVMSGEIEMLTVAAAADTLTIVVLIDLRGTWQGAAPGG